MYFLFVAVCSISVQLLHCSLICHIEMYAFRDSSEQILIAWLIGWLSIDNFSAICMTNFKNTILHIIDVLTCAVVDYILIQYAVGTLIYYRNLQELWHQTECKSETSISDKRYKYPLLFKISKQFSYVYTNHVLPGHLEDAYQVTYRNLIGPYKVFLTVYTSIIPFN